MKVKDSYTKERRHRSPVERVEAVKCWASLGNGQQLEPGWGREWEGRRQTRLEVGYGQLARNEEDLGVPLRNLDFISV